MRNLLIAIVILISYPAITHAENYRFDGLYEVSAPEDWRVVSSSHTAELMKQASKIANEAKVEFDVDLKDIAMPFMIYKEKGNEAFLRKV